jgi:hypothetical protein
VDVKLQPKNAAPVTLAPVIAISSAGTYPFTLAGSVDTSGADYDCCNLTSGQLVVDPYVTGATSISGKLTVPTARPSCAPAGVVR